MKSLRLMTAAAVFAIGAFSAITYTSCNTDKCANVSCPAGSSCDGNGNCVDDRTEFVKTWNASDMTPSGSQIYYTSTITLNTSYANEVIISAIRGDNTQVSFFGNPVYATVSGNTITIPSQTPDVNGDYKVSGNGTYSSGVITWSYTLTQISTGTPKYYTGTWN